MGNEGIGAGAVGRSAAAAGGAVVGALVAVPVGTFLFEWLWARLGDRLIDHFMAGGNGDELSGLEAVIAAVFVAIAAAMAAVLVVLAMVAPVFVLLPMAGIAGALYLVRAALIPRTLAFSLAGVFLLGVSVPMALSSAELRVSGWVWVGIIAVAAFLARIVVELWKPGRAVRPPLGVRPGDPQQTPIR